MSNLNANDALAFVLSSDMAKALTDRWRSRVLMELSVRPLSPKEFIEEVGGDPRHIRRCFTQLANLGFAEIVETRKGGRRRGAIEHVYRRIQRAHLKTSIWESLPRSNQEAFSRSIVESYVARINEALETGTLDDEIDSHLSWDVVALDRIAWTQLVTHLDAILAWLPELAVEASRRMKETGEDPIPTTVSLAGFRSPKMPEVVERKAPRWPGGEQIPGREESHLVIPAKLAKAAANKWRARILMELRVRTLSPTQFHEEIGGDPSHIARYFRELLGWGYIEVIEERKGGAKGGRPEKVYRSRQRAYFDTGTWAELPRFLRDELSLALLESFFVLVTEAIQAGTFDGEVDSHFSWDGIALDRVAWAQLMSTLDEVLQWVVELEQESAKRIAQSGEKPIPVTVGLAGFRSPKAFEVSSEERRRSTNV